MWLFAIFDLPVETSENRRDYSRFRKVLLKTGFSQLQFSVYARFLPSDESAETCRRILRAALPPLGEVRLLSVTDRQFGKMEIYLGKRKKSTEAPPPQLVLF
jgi:CRISPR-associated protein Cas2